MCTGLMQKTHIPLNIKGLTDYVNDPSYSTVIGLLHYGTQASSQGATDANTGESVVSMLTRLKNWFKGEF